MECRSDFVHNVGRGSAVLRRVSGGDFRGGVEGELEVPDADLPHGVAGGQGLVEEDDLQGCFKKVFCGPSLK